MGFSPNRGTCSITVAELSAISQGSQLAKSRGYPKTLIETDSQLVINLITRSCPTTHPCHELVSDMKNLAAQVTSIHLSHTLREANQVADALVKLGLFQLGLLKIYDFSSNCISLVLLTDRIDTLFDVFSPFVFVLESSSSSLFTKKDDAYNLF